MTKKTVLGIDIGQDTLKLALCKGGRVRKLASAAMPKNMVKEGRIVSPESMGELLRRTIKQNRMHASLAALALSNETSYVRTVTMPIMSAEQLTLNIPYEFNDYITDELKNYVFDYAMVSTPEDLIKARFGGILPPLTGLGRKGGLPSLAGLVRKKEEVQPEAVTGVEAVSDTDGTENGEGDEAPSMDVMVAAVRTDVLTEARETLRRAGLKLLRAAPSLCGYISLIRSHGGSGGYCILDLGFQSIRMYMFQGDRHVVTRVLETGLSVLDTVIADAANVDVHLAHTYLTTNYNDCQNQEYCVNAYNNISIELIRALNFYNFSNPDSNLTDIWLCGGGAAIEPLRSAISEALDLQIHPALDLIPALGLRIEDAYNYVEAIGIAMDA